MLEMVGALVFLHMTSYLLGLAEKKPSVPQAELLLKDQEMIEVSDDENTLDHDLDAIEDAIGEVPHYKIMSFIFLHSKERMNVSR